MIDVSAPRAARASASRVVALMATAGGEWPSGWGGLIPSLIGQLAMAAAAVENARAEAGSAEAPRGGVGGMGREGRRAEAAAVAAEHAVARAESCAKCLQYLTEEVPMEHVPEVFQQAFPGLVEAGKADYLPRSIRRRVFRIVRELFTSIGTLVSVRGETRLLPGLQQCVPPWLHLVSKTLQSAVDGRAIDGGRHKNGGNEEEGGGDDDFGVELEGLRTAMVLLAHVPSTVGDGHLGQLLPPLWQLLTDGRERHERSMLAGGGDGEDGDEDGDGGDNGGGGGYASDGERQGLDELIVQSLELLAATAACPDPQVSGLLGGEGAGVGSLLAVVIRWRITCIYQCANHRRGGGGGAGRHPVSTARSAGLALIRELCEAFPDKVVPALIAEAKSALVDSSSSSSSVGSGGGDGEAGAVMSAANNNIPAAADVVPSAVAAAALSARRWRLREAALLCLGVASKPITRQVKRRCPLAVKLKKEQQNNNITNSGGGSGGGGSSNANGSHAASSSSSSSSSCWNAPERGTRGGEGAGGGAGAGGKHKCKHSKASSFSPGTLCRGARGLGLDLGGFQAVIVAAAEGRSHHPQEVSSPFVHARGLWATARFASLLSAEGVCRSAEACSLAMGEGRPLCLRLHACRALRVLGQYSARIARRGGFFGIKRGAGKALLGSRVGTAARAAVTAAPGLAACFEEGTAHFAPETMTQLVKAFPAEAVAGGGDLVLMQLSMSLWRRYPSDPLVVEAVEDLLLALTRVPQAVPRMTETLVPLFQEVFERRRAGEEELQAVAEGCLSLLRELTTRLAAAGGGVGGVHSRGGAGRTDSGGGFSAAATRCDSSARLSLWAGLRAAFPLLLETDSHSLVQDGCSTLQEFVTAFGDEMHEDADVAAAAAAAAGGEASGGGESGGGGDGDSPLSLVLSFLARVMDPEAHDASALRIGGLVSAVLKSVPPRSLGRETVQSLLAVTFDKLERCSSSLLGDELLQVFVTFVNSEAYGPTALADVFAEIEREGGRRRCQQEEDATTAMAAAGPTERPLSNATIVPPPLSSSCGSGGISNGGAGGERLGAGSSPAAAAVGAVARGGGGGGVGNDDTMASLRRLIGLWLFFHEMARSSSLASQSALGLVRLLQAAGDGDARLYTLRVSTDSMGSGSSRGAGVRGRSLPPSLRKMEGELLPVCLLSSIVRTAERDEEADGPPEGVANNNNRSCEDGGAMFPLDVEDDDDNADEDAYMADEFDPAGPPEGDTDDDSDDDDDDDDDSEEDDEDEEESDTEDITDEGSITLSSCSGGGDGGGVPSPYYASGVSQRFAAAVNRRPATAAPPLSSSAPAPSAQVAAAAAATAPMVMSVDSSHWAGATSTTVTTTATASSSTAFSAAGLPCFSGGSVNLTRCSSSNSLPAVTAAAAAAAPAWRGRSASGDGITCRVSSAPLAAGGGGDGAGGGQQLLSSSCPRDASWLVTAGGGNNHGGTGSSYPSLSTIHDHRRSQRPSAAERQAQAAVTAAASGVLNGGMWEHVARSWGENGVGRGLVDFLRSTTGTRSEALLCGWAGMLPPAEQATLTALLDKTS
ncbi:unnamed protein product [Ectocarpus sp. CCAP 1310/34]|nr:unnamed protein product [Ectocarpus sp. CCAP 1310/34]